MEKKTLTFRADNQILVGQNVPARLASDTVSYIEAVFDLGENWSGFDAVKAVWSTDFDSLCTVLDSSGACVVPYEVLERVGDVWVNLVGSISEDETLTDRLTTYPIKAVVVDANAAVCGSETSPITPSQFDQFVEVVRADADRAEEGATEAAASASSAAASATSASGSATDASQSASGAAQSAQSASESADSAERSAQSASDSASDAEEAKQTILNMTATATTLPEGSEATVDYSNGVMAFGIPKGDTGARGAKGDTGETGATPNLSIGTVETLAPDEDATATITGTAENPVLNLGLPKGETGEVSLEALASLMPLETVSGSVASFSDGSAVFDAESAVVTLEPVQEGTPWIDSVVDFVPYTSRAMSDVSTRVGSHESLRKIVGGTVAFNQLVQITNGQTTDRGITATIDTNTGVITLSGTSTTSFASVFNPFSAVKGHVYIRTYKILTNPNGVTVRPHAFNINWNGTSEMVIADGTLRTGSGISGFTANTSLDGITMFANIIDLTQWFGTTIADYIYSLEQAHAGDGVAFFKALFPEDYHPYDAGTLKSVQTSAHKTYDADGNVIGNYPLDSSLTLRGVFQLDNGELKAYGDIYPPSGQIERKFDEVDLGTLNWARTESGTEGVYYFSTPSNVIPVAVVSNAVPINGICVPYVVYRANMFAFGTVANKAIGASDGKSIRIRDDSYTDAAAFKAAMSGTMLVYEKATPTTESATPYTELQSIESGGSEEFVGAEIPVGHESTYSQVYPISRHDSASVVVSGVNVWDEEWEVGGINTSGQETSTSDYYRSKNYTAVLPNTTYYFKVPTTMSVMFYDSNKDFIEWTTANNATVTTPSNCRFLRFRNTTANTWTPYDNDISINYPSTDHDYHAYQGTSYTTSLGRTVYGGTVDLVSGVLTVERVMVDLGTLNWSDLGSYYGSSSVLPNVKAPDSGGTVANAICEKYEVVTSNGVSTGTQQGIGIRPNGAIYVTDFGEAPSGNICYELATPTTYQLTPQAIALLTGDNNVWSEDGSIEVKYRANIGLYVDKKISEVNA